MAATSGTTTRLPVNSSLSPARARSTCPARNITSTVRGRLPAGTCHVGWAFACAIVSRLCIPVTFIKYEYAACTLPARLSTLLAFVQMRQVSVGRLATAMLL